jgi:hypothetical protein
MDNAFRLQSKWHWLLIILAMPFLLFPSPTRILALLILPVIWLLRWKSIGSPFPRIPLNASLLLLATMVLVSTWATYDLTLRLL